MVPRIRLRNEGAKIEEIKTKKEREGEGERERRKEKKEGEKIEDCK